MVEEGLDPEVALEPIALAHVTPRYVAWLNDYEVVKHTEQRFVRHDLASVEAFVRDAMKAADARLYAIRADDRHVGNLKIGPIDKRHRAATISYFVGERTVWGRGVASEAIAAAMAIARDPLGLARLGAGVYDGNVGSVRALEKNGFLLEGRLVGRYVFEGRRVDGLLFGALL